MRLQGCMSSENVRQFITLCQAVDKLVRSSINTCSKLVGGTRKLHFETNADILSMVLVVEPVQCVVTVRTIELEAVCGPGLADPYIQVKTSALFGTEANVSGRNANRVGVYVDPRHLAETLLVFKDCNAVSVRLAQWRPNLFSNRDAHVLNPQARGLFVFSGEIGDLEVHRQTVVQVLTPAVTNAVFRPMIFKQSVLIPIVRLERLRHFVELMRSTDAPTITFRVSGTIPGYEKWQAEKLPLKVTWSLEATNADMVPALLMALQVGSVNLIQQTNPRDTYFYSSLYQPGDQQENFDLARGGLTYDTRPNEADIDFVSSGEFDLKHFYTLVCFVDALAYKDNFEGKRGTLAWYPDSSILKLIVHLDDAGESRSIVQLSA